jgi:hypothetical protein
VEHSYFGLSIKGYLKMFEQYQDKYKLLVTHNSLTLNNIKHKFDKCDVFLTDEPEKYGLLGRSYHMVILAPDIPINSQILIEVIPTLYPEGIVVKLT